MARAARTIQCLARALLGAVALCGVVACETEGTTASCRTEDGGELPLYDIDDVDDSGVHPDPEIEDIRAELVDRDCLTQLGHATSPEVDSGSD